MSWQALFVALEDASKFAQDNMFSDDGGFHVSLRFLLIILTFASLYATLFSLLIWDISTLEESFL